MTDLTLVEAVNCALAVALSESDDVVVFGQDVGRNGGVFRATDGLMQRFGTDRVVDTPLAENMICGIAVGMAAQGLRPVAEIQFMGFAYPALDQLVSHASRLRNRTRGRLSCPMVLRAPFGGGIHAPEHHSESTEAMFAHIPGLRVIIPSSPARAGYWINHHPATISNTRRKETPSMKKQVDEMFRLSGKDAQAEGVLTDGGFLVRAGAIARKIATLLTKPPQHSSTKRSQTSLLPPSAISSPRPMGSARVLRTSRGHFPIMNYSTSVERAASAKSNIRWLPI